MHIDDRLATVLRIRASGELAARTQYRQLVDLLGTLPSDARSDLVDAAWVRLAELTQAIPPGERAAALGEPGLRLRSPRLIADLARSEPAVAAAAIGAARLSESEWLDLVPALPIPTRGLVRQRTDLSPRVMALLHRLGIAPRGLPAARETRQVAANDEHAAPLPQPSEGIGAIVQRIEAYRKRKAETQAPSGELTPDSGEIPALGLEPLAAFAFTCDEAGRIDWADQTVAPAVTGMRIGASDESSPAQSTQAVTDAFRRRQPLRAGRIVLAGAPAIAGNWQLDATPMFDRLGHFTGYQGLFRRPATASEAIPAHDSDADRMRQLLHELRTPVNAIQGFAEVIQQQLFGPTPHEYRAHAAAIAGDAARMLAGFDELERLARLDSGAMTLEAGHCDFAAVAGTIAQQLDEHLSQRGCGFDLSADPGAMNVELDPSEAERLAWRLLATLAGAAAPGERLRLRLRRRHGMVRLGATLPAALAVQEDLFHAAASSTPSALSAGMFGAGFALRLVATEARSAGGKFERRDAKVRLELPEAISRLTPLAPEFTQQEGLLG